jgi:H+/Cl- antiporter ClcA
VGVEAQPPRLADETRWYTEHTALLISTLKWALLGAAAGLCVGFGTRAFLWSLAASGTWVKRVTPGGVSPTLLLPLALPACVLLIRRFAPTARGHGTEAVISAIHRDSGRIPWKVAPIKLLATVVTLAFGGSVGKEGPCAQIGAAITSLFADVLSIARIAPCPRVGTGPASTGLARCVNDVDRRLCEGAGLGSEGTSIG